MGRLGDEKTRSIASDPLDDTFYRVRSSACLPPRAGGESGRNGVLPPPRVAAGDAPEADEGTNDAATGTRNRDPAVREAGGRSARRPLHRLRRGDSTLFGQTRLASTFAMERFGGAHLYKRERERERERDGLVRFPARSRRGTGRTCGSWRTVTTHIRLGWTFYKPRCSARLPPTEGWDLAWDGEEPAPKLTPNARRMRSRRVWAAMCIAANSRRGGRGRGRRRGVSRLNGSKNRNMHVRMEEVRPRDEEPIEMSDSTESDGFEKAPTRLNVSGGMPRESAPAEFSGGRRESRVLICHKRHATDACRR